MISIQSLLAISPVSELPSHTQGKCYISLPSRPSFKFKVLDGIGLDIKTFAQMVRVHHNLQYFDVERLFLDGQADFTWIGQSGEVDKPVTDGAEFLRRRGKWNQNWFSSLVGLSPETLLPQEISCVVPPYLACKSPLKR